MAWRVRFENQGTGETSVYAGQETTEQKAFNTATDRFMQWMQGNWGWQGNSPAPTSSSGGTVNGPAPGSRFKIYFDTQQSGNYFICVKWDYEISGSRGTNTVYFRVFFE